MTDKYTEKQLQHYQEAKSEAVKDDVLYRLGTHLEIHEEVLPPDGNANLTQFQRDAILQEVERRKQ
jgi:dsRNA-specific ribonuclease